MFQAISISLSTVPVDKGELKEREGTRAVLPSSLAYLSARWPAVRLSGGGINGKRQGCQMAKFDPFLSLDCARVEGVGAQSKERKGSNFAALRSRAIVQKPEGPNAYNLKIWL